MKKASALLGLMVMLPACVARKAAWQGQIEWPKDYSDQKTVPFMEAGAALAAAGAIRELVKKNPHPQLFWGCPSPEQGLDVGVFKGPTPGLYYVLVDQRFDRCGGPRVRVLDGWYEYAVTPQGEVVAEAPPHQVEAAEELVPATSAQPTEPVTPGPASLEGSDSAPPAPLPTTPSAPPADADQ